MKSKTKTETKVLILDDNPLSIASYAEEYPKDWKKVCNVKNSERTKEMKPTKTKKIEEELG